MLLSWFNFKPMAQVRLPNRAAFARLGVLKTQTKGAIFRKAVLTVLPTVLLAGCGSESSFELASVEGKITYADGSLIKADQILVKLVPQGIEFRGKVAPRAAETYAAGSDGRFSNFTTWKYEDGVMVGKHKVIVISLRPSVHGAMEPTKAIPQRYHRQKTTPLEVEVSARGDNNFTFEIEKK